MRRALHRHDLTRRELASTQRAIRILDRRGTAPSANDFWEQTAVPRARRLVDEVRFAFALELALPDLDPGLTATLAAALPTERRIDDLGRWWQHRLRRAAMVRAFPQMVGRLPADAELTVAHHEMDLLDRPPWSHGDRLLSAFELAHAELRRFPSTGAGASLAARPPAC